MDQNRPWKNRTRIVFSPEESGVPDVIHFGRYNYVRAGPALAVHVHEQAMEFCFLVRGRQTYRVGRQRYRLTGGDVFVTFPDEPHSTGEEPEEKGVLYWFTVRIPPAGGGFLGLPKNAAESLRASLIALPRRRFLAGKHSHAHLDAIVALHLAPPSPLRPVAMLNRLIALLLEVVSASGSSRRRTRNAEPALNRVLHHIEQNLTEPLAIPALAAITRLSVPRFKDWFKQEMGVPPGEYVLRARVEAARRQLISSPESITTISFALGFSSSQYFATVVKRYTGHTPGELRKSGGAAR